MKKIKVAICGYGNLGKGVEKALLNPANNDMELVAIFTRRNPKEIENISNVEVISTNDIKNYVDKIDVVILCGGSAKDLPEQGPSIANMFNTVDSFDTHAHIPEYFEKMNIASNKAKKISVISVGWDPRDVLNCKGICRDYTSNRRHIYILGERCKSRTFRCN